MSQEARDKILLESAKANLRSLAFYGIKERMPDSQWMFEQLFQLQFTANLSDWKKSKSRTDHITEAQWEVIRQRNHLDVQLYEFAVRLFEKRLKQLRDDAGVEQAPIGLPLQAPRLNASTTELPRAVRLKTDEAEVEKWEQILDEDAREDQIDDDDDPLSDM